MAVSELLALYPATVWIVAGLLGLIVGSFLNVVIYRVPVMLQHSWRSQCHELLELKSDSAPDVPTEPFNLVVPRSRCPHCAHAIRAWENIPVLSFLFLRGRCIECKKPISKRYPAIELVTGILSAILAAHYGFTVQTLAALLFAWMLIALTFIDLDHQLLPDNITLPLLWLGLIVNLRGVFVPIETAIIGAVAGYLSLWLVFHAFKLLTGKEGMGYGDFKLLAAAGAWLGWQMLPLIILLASMVGAVVGIAVIALKRHDRRMPIPFGPFLCAASLIAMVWGEQLVSAYLRFARIPT